METEPKSSKKNEKEKEAVVKSLSKRLFEASVKIAEICDMYDVELGMDADHDVNITVEGSEMYNYNGQDFLLIGAMEYYSEEFKVVYEKKLG